jgi:hypothetical protein
MNDAVTSFAINFIAIIGMLLLILLAGKPCGIKLVLGSSYWLQG